MLHYLPTTQAFHKLQGGSGSYVLQDGNRDHADWLFIADSQSSGVTMALRITSHFLVRDHKTVKL